METTNTKTALGYTITLILAIIGFYLIWKHHKAAGFWWGILAMFLLVSYVATYKNGEWAFSTPVLSVEPK